MTFRKWACFLASAVLLGGCSVSSPTKPHTGDAPESSTSQSRAFLAFLPSQPPVATSLLVSLPVPPFSEQEVNDFLAVAVKAEAISDPLQRCLSYPNPPGSHWSKAAVEAFCQYYVQPIIGFAEVKALVNSGRASELDQRFTTLLHEELTQPKRRGALEHTFFAAFSDVSPGTRAVIDEWKRESPNSAFAYAASGFNYEDAAFAARGKKEPYETPLAKFEAMDELLPLATADLNKALHFDKRVLPAYGVLIEIAALHGDTRAAIEVAQRGLAVDPENLYIYSQLLWSVEPRWGGSEEAKASVVASTKKYVAQNPLLLSIQSQSLIDAADLWTCDCESAAGLAAYRRALDEVAMSGELQKVGTNASENNQQAIAVIYLSEALRFDPKNKQVIDARKSALNRFTKRVSGIEIESLK